MEGLGPSPLRSFRNIEKNIYSVSQLTWLLKQEVESQFPLVWVRGQISNLSRPTSGHIYFSLKDDDSQLPVVWFKSNQFTAQHGLLDNLYNGQEVICAGKVSLFTQRGIYQLIAEYVEDFGVGRLYIEFERLKKKLNELGFFDAQNKIPVPRNPKKVAIITAITGAAIRDFFKIVKEKGIPTRIRVYPSSVQGNEAKTDIIQMIEIANIQKWADVIVIIRGGGSIEDLSVFNTEEIARAIFKSKIPVVTGIGHEIDVTIADMVADLRLATPTHVAEYLFDHKRDYEQIIDQLSIHLKKNILQHIKSRQTVLTGLFEKLRTVSVYQRIKRLKSSLDNLTTLLIDRIFRKIESLTIPLKVIFLNFVMASDKNIIKKAEHELNSLTTNLIKTMDNEIKNKLHLIELLENRLRNLDPNLPLKKGYSVVLLNKKEVTNSSQLSIGDTVNILFYRGRADAKIQKKYKKRTG